MARFGKYELVKKLASGGMGEIYLARSAGAGGFEKLLVIKRLLPHLARNEDFLELFLSEARIAARLNHPNVVQIFELGDVRGDWYLAMEYVAGRDLARVVRRAKAAKKPLPLGAVLRIVSDAAAALDYAHETKDAQGRLLGIVHRDVSPHNVLVGFDGSVKLIDFGVAKAADRLNDTAGGALRGKFAYMSPEQASGEGVDHRSDLFSLGVVFWELLTGRRLFRSESDTGTLKLVAQCRVRPPSAVAPELPRGLDEVVLRALAKDPSERYADAGELRMAIEDLAVAERLPASTAHLEAYMRELFHAEVDEAKSLTDPGRTYSPRPSSAAEASNPLLAPDEKTEPLLPNARIALPMPLTAFVGRDAELDAVDRLFRAGERLVTLVGPAGIGKSRLAVEYALHRAPQWTDGGARLVDLSAIDADDVCRAVAWALDVALVRCESPDEAASLVASALDERGAPLVVLDDFPPLAAAWLTRWLAGTTVRFLVTARAPLKLDGEICFEVPPLSLPREGEPAGASEAVRLLLARTRPASPDPRAAAGLALRLAGVPLALELAARHLVDAASAPPPDLAVVRAVVAWAFESLRPFEQAALAQASLFDGSFTLEAAEAVIQLSRWPDAPWVLDVMQSLRDRALVQAFEPPGAERTLRFTLDATVRAYARERLESLPERADAERRFADFFLALAAESAGSAGRLGPLALEHQNLTALVRRARTANSSTDAVNRALQAVLALESLYRERGPAWSYRAMLETAIRLAESSGADQGLLNRARRRAAAGPGGG